MLQFDAVTIVDDIKIPPPTEHESRHYLLSNKTKLFRVTCQKLSRVTDWRPLAKEALLECFHARKIT